MSTMLTDLMQQLQDIHTYHPGDDGRSWWRCPPRPTPWNSSRWEKSTMTDPRWSCTASPSRMNRPGHRTNRQGIRMNRPVPLR